MKLNIKNIGLTAMAAFALASCSDVVDYSVPDKTASNGAPVIESIYDVQDTGYAAPLVQGELDQMLHIKGQNLSHVKKITFNGVDVDVKQVYAESENSYVKIPRVIPEQVTDTLVYETEQGTVRKYFPVSIPAVQLNGLMNEFALQGSAVQLNGSNFDLYEFGDTTDSSPVSIEINNAEEGYHKALHTDSCTETYTSIVIPKDCPDNSLITFKWKGLNGEETKTVPYRMTSKLLFGNMDGDMGTWNDWGKGIITDGSNGGPANLGYQYIRITGTFDPWAWNSTGYGFAWPDDGSASDPSNYVLKFEVNSSSSTPFVDYGDNGSQPGGNHNGGYNFTFSGPSGADGRNQWDPVTNGLRNTYGEWETVSIPLADALRGGVPTVGAWTALEIVLQPNTNDPWTVDHSFGQFRIEPKNY